MLPANEAKPKLYSNFQMNIFMQTDEINNLIKKMDNNNLDLKNDIEVCQTEFNSMEAYMKKYKLPTSPGEKIMQILKAWNKDVVYTDEDIENMRLEMWLTLKEFEDALKHEEKGIEMDMRML